MSDKNKGNAKSDQSKQWIEEALLKLMHTDNYHEITIQEITDHAGLTRRTFYRNYSSKDEILKGCFYRIWQEYMSLIKLQTDLSLPNISKVFFSLMLKHMDFLSLVNRHQLIPLFLTDINELLPLAFDEFKGDAMPFSKESIQYALTFSIGGFMRILVMWLNDSEPKSPEKMAAIIKDCVLIFSFPPDKSVT